MTVEVGKALQGATNGQLEAIVEILSELELDDAQNSIENAMRCLNEQGYLELDNMVKNYYYRAGINHMKNEIRTILGLPVLMTDLERRQREDAIKYPMGSSRVWDCPELQPSAYEVQEGSAKLIPVGDDCSTMIVIGTKDIKKAGRLMRRYQRDYLGADPLIGNDSIETKDLVWRAAKYDHEEDYSQMFSWSEKDTKNNPHAVLAFIGVV